MESRTPALEGFNYIHVCLPVSENITSSIPHRHAQWLDSSVTRSYQVENQQVIEPGTPQCIQRTIDANNENNTTILIVFPVKRLVGPS